MERILIVGCGDIAMRVARLLHKDNDGRYRLFGLVRNAARFDELRSLGITPVLGDLDGAKSLRRLAGLANVVLHFAPPSAGKSLLRPPLTRGGAYSNGKLASSPSHSNGKPVGSPPHSNARLASSPPFHPQGVRRGVPDASGITLSQTKGGQGEFSVTDTRTRNLLAILSQGILPSRLVYISTSGVYGDCGGAIISETHPLNAQTARAQRRIDAEQQIRTWARRNRVHASILRVPGIYAADRLPLDRLRVGTPAIVQEEDSYTNHIHADDLARIVIAAMHNAKPNRIYHTSDDSQLKMGDYFDAVADAHHLPRPPRLPRAQVERAVSPMLWTFMNESRRLTNVRMKRELRVKLRYPEVENLMREISFD